MTHGLATRRRRGTTRTIAHPDRRKQTAELAAGRIPGIGVSR